MKIFSIVGPTAVGKTSFALELAAKILKTKNYSGVDLVSVDSRQIYQGLEIISGADVPDDFSLETALELAHPFFSQEKMGLHGVSILSPDQEWSVAHFQDLVWKVIKLAQSQDRLVMLVGGTGLYHDQLLNFNTTLKVKPNHEIRQKAEQMELTKLQDWARATNPARFSKMNNSDINNPRRLIRVIEVSSVKNQQRESVLALDLEQIYIGLNQDLTKIEQKIKQRVQERFLETAIEEVKELQQKYGDWSLPAFSALGVKEISLYLGGSLSRAECLSQWSQHELQYAKRQLTWWKHKNISWFDIDEFGWKQSAFAYILSLC